MNGSHYNILYIIFLIMCVYLICVYEILYSFIK